MVDVLPDQLRLMASAYPDEVAYRNLADESSITFGSWERESNRLAHGLQAKGIRKGDLVAIDLEAEQILDFIVTYSAVHKIGAVSVPMNNRLSPPEIRSILEHAEVTAIVCSSAFEDAVARLSASLTSLAVVATVGPSEHGRFADLEDVKSEDASAIQVPIDATDLADVMYTSGTTGMPKGVAVRHGNIAMLPTALP
jgi:acyl-CoA synthetase (AMP-forming)/AMP-acid ligase II